MNFRIGWSLLLAFIALGGNPAWAKPIEVFQGQEVFVYAKRGVSKAAFETFVAGKASELGTSLNVQALNSPVGAGVIGFDGQSRSGKLITKDSSQLEAICNRIKNASIGCEINHLFKAHATPNDPRLIDLWGLEKIGAASAWNTSTGGGVTVAVIDTGVQYTHPDLSSNILINTAETPDNGVDDDGNGFVDDYFGWDFANSDSNPMDDNGHGSHVSGTIGASGNNGLGVVGVNWNASILSVKALAANGSGSLSSVVAGINYAVQRGAKVINLSLGSASPSTALEQAITAAGNAGVLVIAAAGNEGTNNDSPSTPSYPANYTLANVISVAATDRNDGLASFSNYGLTKVHLGAPGVGILSTVPTNAYASFNGTSMATPHVAGAVALVKSANSALGMLQVKDLILNNVDLVSGLTGKTITGGRLNVAKAVAAATGSTPSPDPTPSPNPAPDPGGGENPGGDDGSPGDPGEGSDGLLTYLEVTSKVNKRKVNLTIFAADSAYFGIQSVQSSINCAKGKIKKIKMTNLNGEAAFKNLSISGSSMNCEVKLIQEDAVLKKKIKVKAKRK